MNFKKTTSLITAFLFMFFTVTGITPGAESDPADTDDQITRLLSDAENSYQNGRFKEAIGIYEKIIEKLNEKKELVETRQKLFRTILSLGLTYFTIQETDKSEAQLKKLLMLNPRQEIDEEIYPPGFVNLFRNARKELIGEALITTEPAGAAVSVDGKPMGPSPLNMKNVLKGDYAVKAELNGYLPASGALVVNPGEVNSLNLVLEKSTEKPVVEKPVIEKKGVKKSRKKLSPLLLIGGAAAVGAILLLVLKKKDTEPGDQFREMKFRNDIPVPINPIVPSNSFIEVSGINGKVTKVEFSVTIAHPRIEDLSVFLVDPDNRAIFNIWNKGPHEEGGKTLEGATDIFNSVEPNGTWKINVTNSGERLGGEIVRWTLIIRYN